MIKIGRENVRVKDLKVGDDVLITSHVSDGIQMRKGKVEKITDKTVFVSSGRGPIAMRTRNIVLVKRFNKTN
ncbi:hypothetical protein [Cellulosilyticum lentocellum]|uniref:Uncharacterized protein n=1 Tax=Cellulosilyticum lentocellum (strain ATCC 49066 / DSM 5427 / NCIMB 11756 / RHM5) TaxID=642492 RepID=F2JNB1_CELLD|nr:hypothetical protein [Cellulosilyticum lentocellum]ADZ83565.1 hypothetical protein Clole_1842 [Cellulosilyticum lentocellum DSM 5427]